MVPNAYDAHTGRTNSYNHQTARLASRGVAAKMMRGSHSTRHSHIDHSFGKHVAKIRSGDGSEGGTDARSYDRCLSVMSRKLAGYSNLRTGRSVNSMSGDVARRGCCCCLSSWGSSTLRTLPMNPSSHDNPGIGSGLNLRIDGVAQQAAVRKAGDYEE